MISFRSDASLFTRLFFYFRLIVLLSVAAGVVLLAVWNRQTDPRFYLFLRTPPGIMLSRMMNWPNLYDKARAKNSPEALSEEERTWLLKILADSDIFQVTHELSQKDGTSLPVQLLSQDDEQLQVRFASTTGPPEQRTIARSSIENLEPIFPENPKVTRRDIRFQMEFPDLTFSHSEHYTVLSDAPQDQVKATQEALEKLRSQFLSLFGSLTRYPKPEESLQVLYFTHESDYRAHQNATAPHLHESTGYYSPLEDRMVLYNHQFSDRTEKAHQQVQEEVDFLRNQTDFKMQEDELRDIHQRLDRYIQNRAEKNTVYTLRHEGAHHLSYTYGVHSWIHAENAWLIEGMAAYFESLEPGEHLASYHYSLRKVLQENRVPPLSTLMEVRLPEHFEKDLPNLSPFEAYALSRSLFTFCMQEAYRDAFFRYQKDIQSPDDISELIKTPRLERLSTTLSIPPKDLESEWRAWIRRHHLL